jgi:hypothetical protein
MIEIGRRLVCHKCDKKYVILSYGKCKDKLLFCSVCQEYINNIDNDILISIGICRKCSKKCSNCGNIINKHEFKNCQYKNCYYCKECYINISNPSNNNCIYEYDDRFGWVLHSRILKCASCKKKFEVTKSNIDKMNPDSEKANTKCQICNYNETIIEGIKCINLNNEDITKLKVAQLKQIIKKVGGNYQKTSNKTSLQNTLRQYLHLKKTYIGDSDRIVYFGKYLNKTLRELVNDKEYIKWLLSNDWFKMDYPDIYKLILEE